MIIVVIVIPNLKFQSIRQVYCIEDRANTAARNAVLQSVVNGKRWWRRVKGVNESLNSKSIKDCHWKLRGAGSVTDNKIPGRRRADMFSGRCPMAVGEIC